MIQTVRIDASSFIGKDYEELVWGDIKNTKNKCINEFKICFTATDSAMVKRVTESAQGHIEALQLKTIIKLWEKCVGEWVFLDIFDEELTSTNRNYRFACRGKAPFNIFSGLKFLIDHHKFISERKNDPHPRSNKKQKRNDSIDYDHNKR